MPVCTEANSLANKALKVYFHKTGVKSCSLCLASHSAGCDDGEGRLRRALHSRRKTTQGKHTSSTSNAQPKPTKIVVRKSRALKSTHTHIYFWSKIIGSRVANSKTSTLKTYSSRLVTESKTFYDPCYWKQVKPEVKTVSLNFRNVSAGQEEPFSGSLVLWVALYGATITLNLSFKKACQINNLCNLLPFLKKGL